jgi:steroid 5-alpha reductase family enzyme
MLKNFLKNFWWIVLPVLYVQHFDGPVLGVLDLVGVLVWGLGFYFEAVGDRQLRDFIKDKNNHGKILTTGLWRYTRHPNYFGEVTQWWGIWLLALSVPGGSWCSRRAFAPKVRGYAHAERAKETRTTPMNLSMGSASVVFKRLNP